jgi:hypothetical protein
MTKYRPLPAVRTQEADKPHHQSSNENTSSRMGATFDVGDSRDSAEIPEDGNTSESGQRLSGLKKLQDPSKYEKARFSFRLYKR